jgi:hypothetical protein
MIFPEERILRENQKVHVSSLPTELHLAFLYEVHLVDNVAVINDDAVWRRNERVKIDYDFIQKSFFALIKEREEILLESFKQSIHDL